jgi:hypothetical protein
VADIVGKLDAASLDANAEGSFRGKGHLAPGRRRRSNRDRWYRPRSLEGAPELGAVNLVLAENAAREAHQEPVDLRGFAAEHDQASASRADVAELEEFGVAAAAVEMFQLFGIARISRIVDIRLYEPDPSGALAFITPALVESPTTPESQSPGAFALGNIVDLVAWDPQAPRDWALRAL